MKRFWQRQLHASTLILSGFLQIGLGLAAVLNPRWIGQVLVLINVIGLLGLSGLMVIQRFTEPTGHHQPGWMSALLLGLALLIWRIPVVAEVLIPILYGVWATLRAISKFISWWTYRLDAIRPRWMALVDAIITLGFAVMLLVDPLPSFLRLMSVAGAYALYLGSVTLTGGLLAAFQHRWSGQVSRIIASPMPLFLSLFVPQQIFGLVEAQSATPESEPKPLGDHQLEILFHMKRAGADAIGHVDVIHRGHVYSYGAHDPQHRWLLNGFGEGVFFKAPIQPYLDFCLNSEHKRMVGFVLEPDPSVMMNFETRLAQLIERSTPWNPVLDDPEQPIYAQRLQAATGARLMKFKSGWFKTYFAVSANCVTLVESLIQNRQVSMIRLTPVITPGMYFTLMNNAYRLQTKTIVQRRTY